MANPRSAIIPKGYDLIVMNTQTSTSPLDAIRQVLALRSETYAVEHKFEYWVWVLSVSSAALICQIHGLVTLSRLVFTTDRPDLEPRRQHLN
jgi:hypothetical protein